MFFFFDNVVLGFNILLIIAPILNGFPLSDSDLSDYLNFSYFLLFPTYNGSDLILPKLVASYNYLVSFFSMFSLSLISSEKFNKFSILEFWFATSIVLIDVSFLEMF